MGRAGGPEGTQDADLSSVEAEPLEHLLLTKGQVPAEPSQTCGHLEAVHLEIRTDGGPTVDEMVGEVSSHVANVTAFAVIRYYLSCE